MVLLLPWFWSCENRPTASREDLPLYGDFRAYHVTDERRGLNAAFDTISVYLAGDGVYGGATVKVNGVAVPDVATAGNLALYGISLPVRVSQVFDVDVATKWRSVRNRVSAPGTEPQLVAPSAGAVFGRIDDVPVQWSGITSGKVGLELHRLAATGGLGDTIWTANAEASAGGVSIPAGVWSISDTTALLTLWYETEGVGEGFQGGFYMAAGFAVRRLVRLR
jgi:hypothetical protein